MDRDDPLASFKRLFQSPRKDTIFLDANSRGAMPKTVPDVLQSFCADGWVELRRQGWNHFEWMQRPAQIGASIAHLMGAESVDVLACDNTTVNLFKMLSYAWRLRRGGVQILTETGNFPTDIYVAEGLAGVLEGDPEIIVCKNRAEVLERLGDDTVVYLSHVDYRSGERWNMAEVNERAHAVDALTVWDLAFHRRYPCQSDE